MFAAAAVALSAKNGYEGMLPARKVGQDARAPISKLALRTSNQLVCGIANEDGKAAAKKGTKEIRLPSRNIEESGLSPAISSVPF
jgi:hypothetical protein